MKRLCLAKWTTLAGVLLAAGCASPCGSSGCGRTSFFQRFSMFRSRSACGCDSCGAGGPAIGSGPVYSEGPILGEPPPQGTMLPEGGAVPPPVFQPNLGAPAVPPPAAPGMPERFVPIPTPAPTAPANPSSRSRT
ncbi:MAG TPA: hypothetical protein VN688_28125 [Gemmataceae bacterium]|nr:hypothetical protein [Gemmataceae bacterium]